MKMTKLFAPLLLGLLVVGCGVNPLNDPLGSAGKLKSATSCGDLAANGGEPGRRLQAFLDAAVYLEAKVNDVHNTLKNACADFGRELGMSDSQLGGDTKAVCHAVAEEIKASMKVSLKAGAELKIVYKPAECHVNVDVGASASAECEAHGEASAGVTCEGTCQGTCKGTCAAKNADGSCNGQCQGECQGQCLGHAEASGSAECKAAAEAHANLEAECTPPELTVTFEAGVVLDKSKLDRLVGAIKHNLPKILSIRAKVMGPVKYAVTNFVKTARELAASAPQVASMPKDMALCATRALASAADVSVQVEVKVEVSVEASGEVGGACGAGG